MAKKTNKVVAPIVDTELSEVRHSDLGRAIEGVQDELYELEQLYKRLLDVDSAAATIIRQVLDATDYMESAYDEVSGYDVSNKNPAMSAWQNRHGLTY